MDENIKTWWLTLDERRLHNHLTERLKLPGAMVVEIKEKEGFPEAQAVIEHIKGLK